MGTEYRLHFRFLATEQLEAMLRSLLLFADASSDSRSFEFRGSENTGLMPDASAAIEPGGLYLCDYGGEGRRVLQELVRRVAGTFGPPNIEELE